MFFELAAPEQKAPFSRPDLPPWMAPPSQEAGATLAVERVVARSANVVVLLPAIRVFRTGCVLQVEVVTRQGDLSAEDWWHLYIAGSPLGGAGPGGAGPAPHSLLRMGVRLPDGAKATTLQQPHSRIGPGGEAPAGPLLSWSPSGGGGMRGSEFGLNAFGLWLWPLPPAQGFEFAVEWPLGGIELTFTELDGAAIAAAAARSADYWPGS